MHHCSCAPPAYIPVHLRRAVEMVCLPCKLSPVRDRHRTDSPHVTRQGSFRLSICSVLQDHLITSCAAELQQPGPTGRFRVGTTASRCYHVYVTATATSLGLQASLTNQFRWRQATDLQTMVAGCLRRVARQHPQLKWLVSTQSCVIAEKVFV